MGNTAWAGLLQRLALTLGAPFWFDLLSKLISLRGAGTTASTTDDDNSNTKNNTAPTAPVTNR